MTERPTSTSTKSDSVSRRHRLKRALSRNVQARDFVEDDIKYLWVAYKTGALAAPEGLSAAQFHDWTVDWMTEQYDYAWTIEFNGKPVGVVNGIHCNTFVLLGDTQWLPWASKRNRIEGFIKLISILRDKFPLLGYAAPKDKDFFVHLCKYGLLRRVGTLCDIGEDPQALFQARPRNGRH